MDIRKIVLAASALIFSVSAFSATEHNDIQAVDSPFDHHDNSGPFRKGAELVRHAQNQKRIAGAEFTSAVASNDIGDVAVIVDNGSIIIPPKPGNQFDIGTPNSIRFTPSGPGAFDVTFGGGPFDGTLGSDLGLGDDDATAVEEADSNTFNGGAGFPYLGTSYTTDQIFVGSDGHVTFGAPEASLAARDAGRHIGGPPRVSALFADFDPTSAGGVYADIRADQIVITWDNLPQFGLPDSNTFQAVLWSDGRIDLNYSNVDLPFAVVGIAEGNDEGPIVPVDLTADLPLADQAAGAIFEEFSPAVLTQQMDVIALAKEFYKTHGDDYDFLTMFADEVVDIGGGFAFHLGLHSTTEGLGFFRAFSASTIFDNCSTVGLPSDCELESILNMNHIGLYWPSDDKKVNPPIRKFRFYCFSAGGQIVPCGATFGGGPGADQASIRARWGGTLNGDFGAYGSYTLGLNSAMSIMAQEVGHRWLAFPAIVDHNGALSNQLLGRSNAHWSFFFDVSVPADKFEDADGDPRASSAEGNAISDLGPNAACDQPGETSLFQTKPNELIDGYTELDEYFIGLRKPEDVSDFWYIANPRVIFGGGPTPSSDARDDVLICGTRIDRTLEHITAIGDVFIPSLNSNGTRYPVIGDEQDAGPGIGAADNANCTNNGVCVDVKTSAFILLVGADGSIRKSTVKQVDSFRRVWEEYANGPAFGNKGARGVVGDGDYIKKIDTSLNPAIK